ncbi:MAG: hydroxyneurosporene methyltransferase [Candidatus Solibacter usitatus]|nr:hydroxyneurosporene methyltransferase [Candidatus Solibacter usitatus]
MDLWALCDLCTPWCLHTVATLRIAEHIAAGVEKIEDLAAAARCDSTVLHSVMGHLVSKGVFEEPEPGRFVLNEAARGLLDPGLHLGLDLEGIGGRMAHAWGTMLNYVRTGQPAYREVFGRPFWEDLNAHPDVAASFDALIGPQGHGTPDADFPVAGGWENVRTVVDVGGGTGAMLAEIVRVRSWIRGTLVDLPRTVARAVCKSESITTVGQSFFDPLTPGADLYLLRGVLNDWPDREAVAILKRCSEAAGLNGRVVILKGLREEGAPRGLHIEMILAGGKQRTLAEFTMLAQEAALQVVASGPSHIELRPL